jgi:hypothetical protein
MHKNDFCTSRKQEAERKRKSQGIADYQRIISIGLTQKQLQYESIKAQKN